MESLASGKVLGGSYTGVAQGPGVALAPGVLGKAVHVGVGSSYLDLGAIRDSCFGHPDLCTHGYTLAFWIKRAPSDVVVFYISNGGQTYASYGINVSAKFGGIVHFALKTTTKWYRLDIPVPVETWHHVVMSWYPGEMMRVYLDGSFMGISLLTENIMSSTEFNNFCLGVANNAIDRNFGDAYIDEMLSWDSAKDAAFIAELFASYQDSLALRYEAQGSFWIAPGPSVYGAEYGVEPIVQCVARAPSPHAPHPCRMECLWRPWCGSVLYDGRLCKYYNVFFPRAMLTPANTSSSSSAVFVKQ
jgi:hypothetical protein